MGVEENHNEKKGGCGRKLGGRGEEKEDVQANSQTSTNDVPNPTSRLYYT